MRKQMLTTCDYIREPQPASEQARVCCPDAFAFRRDETYGPSGSRTCIARYVCKCRCAGRQADYVVPESRLRRPPCRMRSSVHVSCLVGTTQWMASMIACVWLHTCVYICTLCLLLRTYVPLHTYRPESDLIDGVGSACCIPTCKPPEEPTSASHHHCRRRLHQAASTRTQKRGTGRESCSSITHQYRTIEPGFERRQRAVNIGCVRLDVDKQTDGAIFYATAASLRPCQSASSARR
ncbi:hypothetical protein HDK77DRAFT_255500 [Phyllosticta capitalensis]